jgi:hypothetical protein
MDALGVLQHHDAATGTAKQAVADNYNSRLFKGMQANNQLFARVINELTKSLLPSLTTKESWQWCVRENSTYLDCPTAEYPQNSNILVAAFNPATNKSDYLEFPVRHGNYDVAVYNSAQQAMIPTKDVSVICENETLANGYTIETCMMYIDYPIDSMQVGIVQLRYNNKTNWKQSGQAV